ncbi:putative transcription factor & chromatin remodeling CW-Zn family [Lupinus albus]|uniref:Putative transcription factor & chromatin remodeling CW-Zn family n=1 Tax=Lupinus albus TaxID=3870 RepID=A0A6A4QZ35_LUPAL|nr:putative transcription factor & chromatin remodeling CW-Zn family [Lupinus albus]
MISVGNRDAGKRLGLGFGVGGMREMEESELEEGEACLYQDHEDYDAIIDPDVSLSYIDEKIQDVLGHFQKDFEGGVSAENLGAKYGGYGSFLPTYPRSPCWGRPRTLQKVLPQNTLGSPNKLQVEVLRLAQGGQGNTMPLSTGSQSLKLGPGPVGSSKLPAFTASMINDAFAQEKCMTTAGAGAFSSKYESLNMNSISIRDHKTLKVQIKMGPDNLPMRKNAAIYCGLGLDESPSSSLDDSPSGREGLSREPQDAPLESPTSILRIMTVLPTLLSPLTNDLIQLNEKETYPRESIPVHMDDSESSGMLQCGSNILKGDQNLSGGKKMKSLEGHESSMEAKTFTKKNTLSDGVLSRKGQGMDELTTEELVSKTLKLPLLSSSYSNTGDSVKYVDGKCDKLKETTKKTMVREKTYSDHSKKGWVEPKSTAENAFVGRTKEGSVDLLQKGRVGPASAEVNGGMKGCLGTKVGDKVSIEDLSVCTAKGSPDRYKICDPVAAEPDVFKVRTTSNIDRIGPSKNPKGSHGTTVTEREKEKLKVSTPLVPKTKKSSDYSSTSKNGTDDVRAQEYPEKARDAYRDFFGEFEEEGDRIASLETPYGAKLKETKVVKRSTPAINRVAKENSGGKTVGWTLASDVYPKKATNVAGSVHYDDTDNGKGGPISAPEDNWVQCDRCQKWRLLPVGTNPDNLPEKWLCSMLNWLPGMNRCSFSEDETTKAVIALCQGPPPEGQSNLRNFSASVIVGGTVPSAQHPDHHQLNHSLHAVTCGKKKNVKEMCSSAYKGGSSQFFSSMKKNLNSSIESRSLNNVNISPVMSDANALREKYKNNLRMLDQSPANGDKKNMMVKSRKNPNEDCSKPYKKSKIDGMHSTDEEWILEQGGTTMNISLPATSVGKNQHRQKSHSSSKGSKCDGRGRLHVSVEITKDKGKGFLDEGYLDLRNHDSDGSVKKRKLKEYQDTPLLEGRVSVQDLGDSRKEKKARQSKSEGRELGSSKGSGRTDKKGSHTKNQKLRQYPGNTLSERSLWSVQASAAATTSSSSEVSGSSPMRILNTDRSTNRELIWKDGFDDTVVVGSPQRCSGGEGSDLSKTVKKDGSDGKVKLKKFGFRTDESENIHIGKKDKTENEKGKKEDQLNKKHVVQEVGIDAICKQEALPAPSQNELLDCDIERSSKRSLSERTNQEVVGKRELSLPRSGGDQVGVSGRFPRAFIGLHKGNGHVEVDPPKVNDASNLQKRQIRKADHQNGTQQIGSKHHTLNGRWLKELESPSPIRKDSNSHTTANSALKDAKDLKHLADRLKNSGSTLESTGIYFQAALKFLHGASLLESTNIDNTNEMFQSKEIYSSTAKLFEFCAREFEKSKDMAAAALAYKCVEVAYMRVIYSANTSVSKDRHELQTALQLVPLGESPPSSASGVDNVNNSTTADKVVLSKSISSPQTAGTHFIAAQNRPNIVRLLNYAQDVNIAMEASRKSRLAFAAANSSQSEGKNADGISSIKQALDFSFHDVKGLLRLVRLAMETIAR